MQRLVTGSRSDPPTVTVPNVHAYVSPWRPWAVGAFVCAAISSIVFSALTAAEYTAFRQLVVEISALPPGTASRLPVEALGSLFDGAAASAVFAIGLTILSLVLSSLLLCCARLSVAHPRRFVSKSFLVAASWLTAAHIANITLQFASYRPLLEALSGELGTAFNTRQLTATVVFGLLSTLSNVALGVTLCCWVDRPDLLQVDNVPAGPV